MTSRAAGFVVPAGPLVLQFTGHQGAAVADLFLDAEAGGGVEGGAAAGLAVDQIWPCMSSVSWREMWSGPGRCRQCPGGGTVALREGLGGVRSVGAHADTGCRMPKSAE